MNTNWTQQQHFAALDWASDHHDVVVVASTGALVAAFRFAHTAAGWAEFSEKMQPFAGAPLALADGPAPLRKIHWLLRRQRAAAGK